MAIYAIGDVQGCFAELGLLLDKLRFDPAADRLWFAGDLVNRGPQSLETLRFVRSLGEAAVAVLGNHDLHLLAVAQGVSTPKQRDTFGDVLGAPDRDELLDWLRRRPLIHHGGGFYLIHAGLPPQWTMDAAVRLAAEAEAVLRGDRHGDFVRNMYGDKPDLWSDDLTSFARIRFVINCLTRLRYCCIDGRVDFKQKGRPGGQPAGLVPWFQAPKRQSEGARILFGHWSTLGFYEGNGVVCLDSGCLWGGELTAVRLDEAIYSISVHSLKGGYQKPAAR